MEILDDEGVGFDESKTTGTPDMSAWFRCQRNKSVLPNGQSQVPILYAVRQIQAELYTVHIPRADRGAVPDGEAEEVD